MERTIDLRSDTVTKPTPGMRRAIAEAEVGDDVFGEDPTVRRLEARVAEMFGKEAALFVPTGTMANQIAIKIHTRPGDEMLLEQHSHIHLWEGGGPAWIAGVTVRTMESQNGVVDLPHFEGHIAPHDSHYTRTSLVTIENTHNRGGGRIQPIENVERISQWARQHRLALHLDGARLMNAVVATGVVANRWAAAFDTVSMCFSKGLGTPVGSILVGERGMIEEAHRVRKVLGGGMRQVGVLAAAALYALDHHINRLEEDHRHARLLADAFQESGLAQVAQEKVETNIVWLTAARPDWPAERLAAALAEAGILALVAHGFMRIVTHLDVSATDVDHVIATIRRLAKSG